MQPNFPLFRIQQNKIGEGATDVEADPVASGAGHSEIPCKAPDCACSLPEAQVPVFLMRPGDIAKPAPPLAALQHQSIESFRFGVFQRLARLRQLDLLEAIGGEPCDVETMRFPPAMSRSPLLWVCRSNEGRTARSRMLNDGRPWRRTASRRAVQEDSQWIRSNDPTAMRKWPTHRRGRAIPASRRSSVLPIPSRWPMWTSG